MVDCLCRCPDTFPVSGIGELDLYFSPSSLRFPNDRETWNLDRQFLWGSSVLVSPVLEEGASFLNLYLPDQAQWFPIKYTSTDQLTFMVWV